MAVTTRSASSSPKKQKRKPRRCTRCPGRPLLSECPHRSFKRTQPVPVGPATPPTNSVLPTPGAPTPFPTSQIHFGSGQSGIDPTTSVTQIRDPQTPAASSPAVNVGPPSVSPYMPIDPTLLEEDLRRSTAAPSPPQPRQGSPGHDDMAADAQFERSETPTSVSEPPEDNASQASASLEKRKQPSGVNPMYGFVDGAGRGNEEYKIYRTRELEPAYEDQADATANLARWTTDLLTRVESISYRTGCWLYLAVQHPMSRTPFIHFISKKLRRDAPTEVEKLHKEVRQLMTTLTRAQKRSAVEAEIALQEAEARAEEANQRAARAESNLAKLKRKLSLLEGGISDLDDLDDS